MPASKHPSRPRHRAPGAQTLAAAALLAMLAAASPAPAQPENAPTTPAEVIVADATTPADRAAAAAELIRLPSPDAALPQTLLSPDHPNAARAILNALRQDPHPHAHWYAPAAALAKGDSPLAADAIEALASFRHRDAAAALVEIVADSRPAELQQAAHRALVRLSGRADIPPNGWRGWLGASLELTERQWEQQLLRAHVERIESLHAAAAERDRQLADAWRQVHLLTPLEQRSDLLAQLIQSDSPVLADLGFELINRELGESRQLQPVVAQAASTLLASPDPSVRARAALLLDRLAPPDAGPAVLAALEREADPRAADALLRAAARWPRPATVKPVLRWLNDPALRPRAVSTAWTLLRDGHLTDEADRQAVLSGARALDAASLSPPACRILASLGDENDLARLQALLADPEPTTRTTAADALALRADQTDVLLAAATEDATLFEPTARALRTHLHDARGYAALSKLPVPSPQIRARVLADYAALLPTQEILRLARLAADPAEALYLLRPLAAPDRAGDPSTAAQLADGLLLLAHTAIALNNPTEALNALTLIPADAEPADAQTLTNTRVTLLLWLNRIDEAIALDGAADAWLDALEHAVTAPHAQAIADGLAEQFPDLPETEAARLDTLRQRLAGADEPPGEDG